MHFVIKSLLIIFNIILMIFDLFRLSPSTTTPCARDIIINWWFIPKNHQLCILSQKSCWLWAGSWYNIQHYTAWRGATALLRSGGFTVSKERRRLRSFAVASSLLCIWWNSIFIVGKSGLESLQSCEYSVEKIYGAKPFHRFRDSSILTPLNHQDVSILGF